jgi:hypothetical protein
MSEAFSFEQFGFWASFEIRALTFDIRFIYFGGYRTAVVKGKMAIFLALFKATVTCL